MSSENSGKVMVSGDIGGASWNPWWNPNSSVWIPQYYTNTNYCCSTAWNMEINFCPVCGKQLNQFNPFTGEKIRREGFDD